MQMKGPESVNEWLAIVGALALWIGVWWRAWTKITSDVNQVGTRVNETRDNCTTHTSEINSLKLEQQQSRDDRTNMRERIAANSQAIKALSEEQQADRIAVMTQLFNNEKAAAERDAQTREALAAIRERLNIEQMVKSVVRNFKDSERD